MNQSLSTKHKHRHLDNDVLVAELFVRGERNLGGIDKVGVDDDLALGLALPDQQVRLAVLPVVKPCILKDGEMAMTKLNVAQAYVVLISCLLPPTHSPIPTVPYSGCHDQKEIIREMTFTQLTNSSKGSNKWNSLHVGEVVVPKRRAGYDACRDPHHEVA